LEPPMSASVGTEANVRQAVPFFWVRDLTASLRFYLDGLGFRITRRWTPEGVLRWCWLELGDAALMLQEFSREGPHENLPDTRPGVGVSILLPVPGCAGALSGVPLPRSRREAAVRRQPDVGDRGVGPGRLSPAVREPDRCGGGDGVRRIEVEASSSPTPARRPARRPAPGSPRVSSAPPRPAAPWDRRAASPSARAPAPPGTPHRSPSSPAGWRSGPFRR